MIIIPARGCMMSCDAVLVLGNAIVNESMLTGKQLYHWMLVFCEYSLNRFLKYSWLYLKNYSLQQWEVIYFFSNEKWYISQNINWIKILCCDLLKFKLFFAVLQSSPKLLITSVCVQWWTVKSKVQLCCRWKCPSNEDSNITLWTGGDLHTRDS
jgi:hypothetical protein